MGTLAGGPPLRHLPTLYYPPAIAFNSTHCPSSHRLPPEIPPLGSALPHPQVLRDWSRDSLVRSLPVPTKTRGVLFSFRLLDVRVHDVRSTLPGEPRALPNGKDLDVPASEPKGRPPDVSSHRCGSQSTKVRSPYLSPSRFACRRDWADGTHIGLWLVPSAPPPPFRHTAPAPGRGSSVEPVSVRYKAARDGRTVTAPPWTRPGNPPVDAARPAPDATAGTRVDEGLLPYRSANDGPTSGCIPGRKAQADMSNLGSLFRGSAPSV